MNRKTRCCLVSGVTPRTSPGDCGSFRSRAEMLSNDRPRLISEHPSQWIGVFRGEVSAKADDLPSLIEELERRGIPPGDTIVRFIEKNQRTLIL